MYQQAFVPVYVQPQWPYMQQPQSNPWYTPWRGLGVADDENEVVIEEPANEAIVPAANSEKWTFSSAMSGWIIGNVPGIAGGIVGFLLAQKLNRAYNVNAYEVLFSTALVVVATFAGLFLVRTYDEFEEEPIGA